MFFKISISIVEETRDSPNIVSTNIQVFRGGFVQGLGFCNIYLGLFRVPYDQFS